MFRWSDWQVRLPLFRVSTPLTRSHDSGKSCKSPRSAVWHAVSANLLDSMMGYGADKGIIPLTTSELFHRVESRSASDTDLSYTVEVSYIEIYNEKYETPECQIAW